MPIDADQLRIRTKEFLAAHPPETTDRLDFLRAQYDAGLAWVGFPEGHGGLGLPPQLQLAVDAELAAASAPDNNPARIGIGLGMAAPTILAFGTEDQRRRWLRPLWTGEEVWCQLFSEPGAGSDLAGLGTRAVPDGDSWIVNGQKVWTSMAHEARWAILVTRTDVNVPKHRGLTYFVADMTAPGVEVRPIRQITGEAEFNEVFLTDVVIPDEQRLGEVGDGWKVAQTTLMNERVSIGGGHTPRESGLIGALTAAWRDHPERRTPGLHDEVLRQWVAAEVNRITGQRLRQQLIAGTPGPEGSANKLAFATNNQKISGLLLRCSARPVWITTTGRCAAPPRSTWPPTGPASLLAGEGQLHRGAVPRRSCTTSSPSASSACRPTSGSTRTCRGRTCPNERPLVLGHRGGPPGQRPISARAYAGWSTVLTRTETDAPYDLDLWRRLATEIGVAGLAVPESAGGVGASWREVAVVSEELGRAVAPVPFLGSAVLATAALPAGDELLPDLASGPRSRRSSYRSRPRLGRRSGRCSRGR